MTNDVKKKVSSYHFFLLTLETVKKTGNLGITAISFRRYLLFFLFTHVLANFNPISINHASIDLIFFYVVPSSGLSPGEK